MNNSNANKILIPVIEPANTEVSWGTHVYVSLNDARAIMSLIDLAYATSDPDPSPTVRTALKILSSIAKAALRPTDSQSDVQTIAAKYYGCTEDSTINNYDNEPGYYAKNPNQ
jgi:hypothetical protein